MCVCVVAEMGVVSQGCSMALDVWTCVGMVWALLGNPVMRLDGPVGVGEWYGIE